MVAMSAMCNQLLLRTGVFLFAAMEFTGNHPQLGQSGALILGAAHLSVYEDKFGNSEMLFRMLSRATRKTVVRLFVGAARAGRRLAPLAGHARRIG
jgi:hypothetical protein